MKHFCSYCKKPLRFWQKQFLGIHFKCFDAFGLLCKKLVEEKKADNAVS